MSDQYRVKVLLVGFDEDRAPELKQILKLYHNSRGNTYFKNVLRRAHEGERVVIYETNDDVNAIRMAQAIYRAGGHLELDGLKEDEPEF